MRSKSLVFSLLGIVVIVGLVGAVVALGPAGLSVPGLDFATAEQSDPPALTSFETRAGACTQDFMVNSSTAVRNRGGNVEITYERNISLADPTHTVGNASLERLNESAYALHVPIESTSEASGNCSAYTRYNASMRIPEHEDGWTVLVYHDGEQVTKLFGNSDSTGVGSSVSVGASVSDNGNGTTAG